MAPYRASLVYEIIVRFSLDFYQTILVGKFPSREISEKCTSRHSRITDIQSFFPFHRTQRILAVVSLSAVETRRGGSSDGGGVRTLGVAFSITFVTQSCVVTTEHLHLLVAL